MRERIGEDPYPVLFGGASHSYEQSSKWKCVPFCLLNPLDES
jgi:hypothetical protein